MASERGRLENERMRRDRKEVLRRGVRRRQLCGPPWLLEQQLELQHARFEQEVLGRGTQRLSTGAARR